MLNKNGQRWVPILDPPIHIKPGYAAYDTGIAQDVFVKDITGGNYVGQVLSRTASLPFDMRSPCQNTVACVCSLAPVVYSGTLLQRLITST